VRPGLTRRFRQEIRTILFKELNIRAEAGYMDLFKQALVQRRRCNRAARLLPVLRGRSAGKFVADAGEGELRYADDGHCWNRTGHCAPYGYLHSSLLGSGAQIRGDLQVYRRCRRGRLMADKIYVQDRQGRGTILASFDFRQFRCSQMMTA